MSGARALRSLLLVGVCAVAALIAVGCGSDGEAADGPVETASIPLDWIDVPTVAANLSGPDGELIEWCLLLAATGEHRQRGLMDAPDADMGGYDGMVFTWEEPIRGAFHMLDTEVPLSIAFFDEAGDFVSSADMDPCPPGTGRCPTFGAVGPYEAAVEVPMGELDRQGTGPGWKLEVGERGCAPRA